MNKQKVIAKKILNKITELDALLDDAKKVGVSVEIDNNPIASNVKQESAINVKIHSTIL